MKSQLALPFLLIAAGLVLLFVWIGQRAGEATGPEEAGTEMRSAAPAAELPVEPEPPAMSEPEPESAVEPEPEPPASAMPRPEPAPVVEPEPMSEPVAEPKPDPESEPAAVPAADSEPAPLPPSPRPSASGAAHRELVRAIKDWVGAWSEQRVDDYLDSYADTFVPEDGMSRARWAAERRERIAGPRFVRVTITGLETRLLGAGTARATFLQYYRSDGFSDTVRKNLELVWEDGRWRIQREYSVGAP